MEGIIVILVLLLLAIPVLAIIAIVRSNRALEEVQVLRRIIERYEARSKTSDVSTPVAPEAEATDKILDDKQVETATPADPPRPAAETVPTVPLAEAPRIAPEARQSSDIEGAIALKWTAWVGAVALLMAGVFLVRYAAENGAFGPGVRCISAAALGLAMLSAAAWLKAQDKPLVDGLLGVNQAPPALAAGGVAVLFGAAYGAGVFYELLTPLLSFTTMALASFVGMGAALYFGPLVAVIGIIGAFATPALVSTTAPSMVFLFAYLTFVTAIAHALVQRTAWTWLSLGVSIGGAVWICIVASSASVTDLWAVASYVPVAVFLALRLPSAAYQESSVRRLAWTEAGLLLTAGCILEGAYPETITRLALFALTPVAIWRAATEPMLDRMTWGGGAAALLNLWLWNGIPGGVYAEGFRALHGTTFEIDSPDFLAAALLTAVVYACLGLFFETRKPSAPRWSALASAMPVLVYAICYVRTGRFEVDPRWGLVGLVVASALTAFAAKAMKARASESAGVHVAGAVAAVALALAAFLRQQWLGMALSLMLPGLAWIEGITGLRQLRIVALLVKSVASTLLIGWLAHDIFQGRPDLAGNPFSAYAVPAAMFALAAHLFRRQRDDVLVATLESGAAAAFAIFIVVETRLWFGHDKLDASFSFDEAVVLMLTFAAQSMAYNYARRRTGGPFFGFVERAMAVPAAALAGGLILCNPLAFGPPVGAWSLACAYLVPAIAAVASCRFQDDEDLQSALGSYAVVAAFCWLTIQIHAVFHPIDMHFRPISVSQAELWLLSASWFAYAVGLMGIGLVFKIRALRMASLAFVCAVCLKVFLVDMQAMSGLWRVAAFLFLGLALIGLAAGYRRIVSRTSGEGGMS
jgi:uncharacterized membrane protein